MIVAPLVGAWIEIAQRAAGTHTQRTSLLSWERGLKSVTTTGEKSSIRSLLSWERGLKFVVYLNAYRVSILVAPLVGAWIEI